MDSLWARLIVWCVGTLVSGLIGGGIVAYRVGSWRERVEQALSGLQRDVRHGTPETARWRQSVEEQLRSHKARLDKGGESIDKVAVLATRLDVLIDELRDIKRQGREDRAGFVAKDECDRRHEHAG